MSTDNLGNENIDMAVGYSNGYKQGFEDGKKDAVKHGHWIFVEKHFDGFKDFACSKCGHKTDVICVSSMPNYCQYCGAKMDGDVND